MPKPRLLDLFYGAVDEAVAVARARGAIVMPVWRSITSRAGQALTAAFMYREARRGGEWYGSRC